MLQLCLDEALTNILSYATDAKKDGLDIRLAAGPTANGYALLIQDDGPPFDPTIKELKPLASSLDEAAIGGHGLRLMRHYLSRISYRYQAGFNALWLEFPVPAS